MHTSSLVLVFVGFTKQHYLDNGTSTSLLGVAGQKHVEPNKNLYEPFNLCQPPPKNTYHVHINKFIGKEDHDNNDDNKTVV